MIKTRSFEIEYNYFEPGTIVTPASSRSALESGKLYKVVSCSEPICYGDTATVFLLGEQFGYCTEPLREATPEEIEADRAETFFWPLG